MSAGPPQGPEDHSPPRRYAKAAAWSVSAGVILGGAALGCLASDAVSGPQAIAIGLPGALLIVGGLAAAALGDPAIARRLGFEAGFQMGWLLTRLRSFFRPPGNRF
jgi:hypothetical protein